VSRLSRIARNSTKIRTGIGVRTRNSRRSNINSRLSSNLSKAMASVGNLANAAKAGTTNAVASSNSVGGVVDLI